MHCMAIVCGEKKTPGQCREMLMHGFAGTVADTRDTVLQKCGERALTRLAADLLIVENDRHLHSGFRAFGRQESD